VCSKTIFLVKLNGYSTIISEEKVKSMGIKEVAFKPLPRFARQSELDSFFAVITKK